ncbi:hypothetical protein PHLCEN_2v2103 [Hermanssonia centrifuga]|uniref:Uncharacterized protein n=1 Tax=Hermanssonia centrifuga TaxID=98765 RepID=A0A2R6RQ55_9APHY|nr:hypothetical protein PHLCEN_2v2103 [Hermanssonia centrifuga]
MRALGHCSEGYWVEALALQDHFQRAHEARIRTCPRLENYWPFAILPLDPWGITEQDK